MRNLTDEFILKYKNNEVISAKCGAKLVNKKRKATKMQDGGQAEIDAAYKAMLVRRGLWKDSYDKPPANTKPVPPANTTLNPTNTTPVNQGYPAKFLRSSYTIRMTAPGVYPKYTLNQGLDGKYSSDKKYLINDDEAKIYGLSPADIAQLQTYRNSK